MRTSRAVWAKRVERWQDSGLTAKEFAAETGVKASTLSHWKWRLAKDEREGKSSSSAKSTRRRFKSAPKTPEPEVASDVRPGALATPLPLIEVQLPVARDGRFEIEFVDGRRLRIPASFDEGSLRRLLTVLQEAA